MTQLTKLISNFLHFLTYLKKYIVTFILQITKPKCLFMRNFQGDSVIAFIAAPLVDIDGICEPVFGSLLYGNNSPNFFIYFFFITNAPTQGRGRTGFKLTTSDWWDGQSRFGSKNTTKLGPRPI